MVISELLNIFKGSQRAKAQDLITSYIGFGAIINIPTIYLASIDNLPVKASIGKLTAKTGRKSGQKESMPVHGFYNFVYLIHKWFYNSYYFYYFPFEVNFYPFFKVLIQKEINEKK